MMHVYFFSNDPLLVFFYAIYLFVFFLVPMPSQYCGREDAMGVHGAIIKSDSSQTDVDECMIKLEAGQGISQGFMVKINYFHVSSCDTELKFYTPTNTFEEPDTPFVSIKCTEIYLNSL